MNFWICFRGSTAAPVLATVCSSSQGLVNGMWDRPGVGAAGPTSLEPVEPAALCSGTPSATSNARSEAACTRIQKGTRKAGTSTMGSTVMSEVDGWLKNSRNGDG